MIVQYLFFSVDIENRFVDTAGEGEDGTNWESGIETYMTVCETDR